VFRMSVSSMYIPEAEESAAEHNSDIHTHTRGAYTHVAYEVAYYEE